MTSNNCEPKINKAKRVKGDRIKIVTNKPAQNKNEYASSD